MPDLKIECTTKFEEASGSYYPNQLVVDPVWKFCTKIFVIKVSLIVERVFIFDRNKISSHGEEFGINLCD